MKLSRFDGSQRTRIETRVRGRLRVRSNATGDDRNGEFDRGSSGGCCGRSASGRFFARHLLDRDEWGMGERGYDSDETAGGREKLARAEGTGARSIRERVSSSH